MPRATSLAADIKDQFGVEPELIAGGGGVFDVHVDSKLVFSKHELDRFPNEGEVLGLMNEMLADR